MIKFQLRREAIARAQVNQTNHSAILCPADSRDIRFSGICGRVSLQIVLFDRLLISRLPDEAVVNASPELQPLQPPNRCLVSTESRSPRQEREEHEQSGADARQFFRQFLIDAPNYTRVHCRVSQLISRYRTG